MPSTLAWMRNPRSNSSAHYLITRKGVVHQLVQHDKRPWSSGRFNRPSARAKKILKLYPWGSYVEPGHYLIQIEFECLLDQIFTEEQIKACVQLFDDVLDFEVTDENLLEHQDTAIDKPDLDSERTKILRRIENMKNAVIPHTPTPQPPITINTTSLEFKNGDRGEIKVVDGKVIITKI